jgi:radical SAM superfamily enzyme YgiQ (UPF0313 family)
LKDKDIVLITPPFTQLNTPYPATVYLKGFLNTIQVSCFQADLGIEVILDIFCKNGLKTIFNQVSNKIMQSNLSDNAKRIFLLQTSYLNTIDPVIEFLQGKNQNLARLINQGKFLPEASRFSSIADLEFAFGNMGNQDKAKHLATLYLEDLSDFIQECIDPDFGFSRYAERLGRSANSFDELYVNLQSEISLINELAIKRLETIIKTHNPKLLGFSVPFPGNLFSAFTCAKYVKNNYPDIKLVLGGGFANTELRELTDVRVFEFFDFVTLDDGELPLELLLNYIKGLSTDLKRTFLLQNNKVTYVNTSIKPDYKMAACGVPDYSDLLLDRYISVIEVTNPMHSLWSDGRWNKLTMAHGCYWGKCTFCDVTLDYIKIYEPIAAKLLVDRVEQLIEQTGERGFHFVDEAAPPALMREFALEVIKRGIVITWWTNIRFEKSFTKDLCLLLKESGCIAVSGGLEVASDRLLDLIKKGVTVQQVAQVTNHLTQAGIMVHAYLMYGYPTQTVQETVDSLEMVRQLFELGIVQSGFWHQFALTAHSPIGKNPEEFGIIPDIKPITFANNDIDFKDKTQINHEKFSFGLKKALFNYMHGQCFDFELQDWFDFKIPRTKIDSDFIFNAINEESYNFKLNLNKKVLWIGTTILYNSISKTKKGRVFENIELQIHGVDYYDVIIIDKHVGEWFVDIMNTKQPITLSDLKNKYLQEIGVDDFELFWFSKPIMKLRESELLLVL